MQWPDTGKTAHLLLLVRYWGIALLINPLLEIYVINRITKNRRIDRQGMSRAGGSIHNRGQELRYASFACGVGVTGTIVSVPAGARLLIVKSLPYA
jgi:hypothetical protein